MQELAGQSLVLANVTHNMTGTYSCLVKVRNSTSQCCSLEKEKEYGRNPASDCQIVQHFKGAFNVTITGWSINKYRWKSRTDRPFEYDM